MWSITAISSASRTGSYRGRIAAVTMKYVEVVRAAIAATIVPGEVKYPSATAWCSETVTNGAKDPSDHSTMSSAAR